MVVPRMTNTRPIAKRSHGRYARYAASKGLSRSPIRSPWLVRVLSPRLTGSSPRTDGPCRGLQGRDDSRAWPVEDRTSAAPCQQRRNAFPEDSASASLGPRTSRGPLSLSRSAFVRGPNRRNQEMAAVASRLLKPGNKKKAGVRFRASTPQTGENPGDGEKVCLGIKITRTFRCRLKQVRPQADRQCDV
jgi:hypothetical protein